jgi:iron(III) transport system substrate-binding protein
MHNPDQNCWCFLLVIALVPCVGCVGSSDQEVVVYSALDVEFSEPLLQQFTQETGIVVRAKYDVESTKTVGLTNALIAEGDRPRCDLFWNNEILNTLRLDRRGLLAVYDSPQRERFSQSFYASTLTWYGFAARARVLIVNTDRLPEASQRPSSVLELAAPRWQGRVAIAKPLFGTTASHATVLFHVMGEARAREFWLHVRDNVELLSGNKQVALAVARGQFDWGLTDTDDAIIEIEKGRPVELIYPDQQEGQMGTLFIPNTLAIIRGGPNPAAARQLLDYLLSAKVEAQLAAGPSAQIPLGAGAKRSTRVRTPAEVRAMEVDFAAAAKRWEVAAPFLRDQFMRIGGGPFGLDTYNRRRYFLGVRPEGPARGGP